MHHTKGWTRRHCTAALLCLGGVGSLVRAATPGGPKTLLVLGDSLSAEYGLPRGSGWVALLAQRLVLEHPGWQVSNASISGETTSGGRTRLPALLTQHRPRLVIIELGGNDALRGLSLQHTRDNLQAMVKACQTAGAQVLLLGMQMPPNYGVDHAAAFEAIYRDVARSQRATLVPFFLRAIADRADIGQWFQSDRIHPTAQSQPLMLDTVWPELKKLL